MSRPLQVLLLVVGLVVLLAVLGSVGAPGGLSAFLLIAYILVGAVWVEGGAEAFRPSNWPQPWLVVGGLLAFVAAAVWAVLSAD